MPGFFDAVPAATSTARYAPDSDLAPLAPLLAGAWARGMADAFETMGEAALLLDGCGRVLHATPAVSAFMGSELAVVSGHLVGSTGPANRAIEGLIAGALEGVTGLSARVVLGEGRSVTLSVRPVAGAAGDDCQLLKAVLLLREDGA